MPSRANVYRTIVRELVWPLLFLLGIGLVSIGVSGVVSAGMRAAFGDRFVAGDVPGVVYTAARCADFREYHADAPTCEDAASAHHADEIEDYRGAAGVLGAAVLVVAWLWRRRTRVRTTDRAILPEGFVATVGVTLFGFATAALAFEGFAALVFLGSTAGPGQFLSGAIVSLVVAALFGLSLLRTLAARAVSA